MRPMCLAPCFLGLICRLSFKATMHACPSCETPPAGWTVESRFVLLRPPHGSAMHMAGFLPLAPVSCVSATGAWMSILPVCLDTPMGRPALQGRAANCFAVAGRGRCFLHTMTLKLPGIGHAVKDFVGLCKGLPVHWVHCHAASASVLCLCMLHHAPGCDAQVDK